VSASNRNIFSFERHRGQIIRQPFQTTGVSVAELQSSQNNRSNANQRDKLYRLQCHKERLHIRATEHCPPQRHPKHQSQQPHISNVNTYNDCHLLMVQTSTSQHSSAFCTVQCRCEISVNLTSSTNVTSYIFTYFIASLQ